MRQQATEGRAILLVEDNPGDAVLVTEILAGPDDGAYDIDCATRLSDALERLHKRRYDVVLVDIDLPDIHGVNTIEVVGPAASPTPIVVLSGNDDDAVIAACMRAGAEDYLVKHEFLNGHGQWARSLRRAIGNALLRLRETQLKQAQDSLARYQALSSSAQGTRVTAMLAGSGALSSRHHELYESLVGRYHDLLQPYLAQLTDRIAPPRNAMEHIVSVIGDHGGGPRDLVDLHVAAIDRAIAKNSLHANPLVYEARLLALEMMGMLVDYYRVGHRRRFE